MFARFHSPAEHDELVKGLAEEMRLRRQIQQLQDARRAGLRTLAEMAEFDSFRRRQQEEERLRKQRQRQSSSYLSGPIEQAPPADVVAAASAAAAQSLSATATVTDGSVPQVKVRHGGKLHVGPAVLHIDPSQPPVDMADAPSADLLTPIELHLCSVLRLLPSHYLVIKDAIVRECFRVGYVTRDRVDAIVKIDVQRRRSLYDFFVSCGWVVAPRQQQQQQQQQQLPVQQEA